MSTDEIMFASACMEFLKSAAISPTVGAAATLGTIGAIGRGAQQYSQARDQGAGVGQALGQGARGALQGAAVGGLAGAGVAGLHPGAGGSISRFGQRQLHGLTGWTPGGVSKVEGLRSMHGGAHDALEGLQTAKKNLHEFEQGAAHFAGKPHALSPDAVQRFQSMQPGQFASEHAQAAERASKAQRAADSALKAESMGITSIPGVLKSVRDNGLLPTMAAGAAEQWHAGSTFDKALAFGLPAYGVANAAYHLRNPEPGAEGGAKETGKQVGEFIGGIAGAPLPFVGQMALQEGAGRIGGGIGSVIDKARALRGPGA